MSKKKKKRARAALKAAAPAFITKSAARYAASTAGKVQCGRGHWNTPGFSHCAHCPELMPGVPVPPLEHMNKSALAFNFWTREWGNSPDPAKREMVNKARYGGLNGGAA